MSQCIIQISWTNDIIRKSEYKGRNREFHFYFGSVGSGKTTLTDLLQRNYVPYSGEILFQGTDIKTTSYHNGVHTLESYRNTLKYL